MIEEKLDILKESEVISEEAFHYSHKVLNRLMQKGIIQETDEADALITHLAMATTRQGSDEVVDSVDESVLKEIKESDYYDEAVKIWNELKEIAPTDFATNEDGYFHLHLVTLLQTD